MQKEGRAGCTRKFDRGAGDTVVNVTVWRVGTKKMLAFSVNIFLQGAWIAWPEIVLDVNSRDSADSTEIVIC